jgi:hypothetical protein
MIDVHVSLEVVSCQGEGALVFVIIISVATMLIDPEVGDCDVDKHDHAAIIVTTSSAAIELVAEDDRRSLRLSQKIFWTTALALLN